MPRLTVLQPVPVLNPLPQKLPNMGQGEARTVAHQAFDQFPPQRYYEMSQQAGSVLMAPFGELPAQTIWGFNGITPGPLIVERYGTLGNPGAGSVLLRLRNNLPVNNGGFGLPSVTTHLHNGHTPLESDGFPCFFMERNKFYDHHYPNVLAGVNSTHPGTGDIKEAIGLRRNEHLGHQPQEQKRYQVTCERRFPFGNLCSRTPASWDCRSRW
jgi:hypothetical protein